MVVFCFQEKKEEEEVFCVHWKFIDGKGTWSQDGCTVLRTIPNHTICRCDHLSSFALLMGISVEKVSRCQTQIKGLDSELLTQAKSVGITCGHTGWVSAEGPGLGLLVILPVLCYRTVAH